MWKDNTTESLITLCTYIILSPVEAMGAVDSDETLGILAGSLHRSVELVHEPLAGHHVSRHLDLGVADAEAAAEAGRVVAVSGGQVDDVGQLLSSLRPHRLLQPGQVPVAPP